MNNATKRDGKAGGIHTRGVIASSFGVPRRHTDLTMKATNEKRVGLYGLR